MAMAWMKATPTTPKATARMVEVASAANSAPRRLPTMRPRMDSEASAPDSPKAMMMPAMMNEARKSRIVPPMLATMPSALAARSLSCGCIL